MLSTIINILSSSFSALLLLCVIILYNKIRKNINYWKDKNIPYIPGDYFSWQTYRILTLKDHTTILTQKIYDSTIKPYVGFTTASLIPTPGLMIRDLDLINKILIKDFDHFVNRPSPTALKAEPTLSQFLVFAQGKDWKNVRTAISPAFTSRKIKLMSNLVLGVVETLSGILPKKAQTKEEFNAEILFTETIIDSIAAAMFGIQSKCLEGNKVFSGRLKKSLNFNFMRTIVYMMAPKICRFINLNIVQLRDLSFISEVIDKAINQKKIQDQKREDFVQHLIDLTEATSDAQDDENEDGDSKLDYQVNAKEGKESKI